MADFQTIKEQVPIEAAAQLLNLELRQAGAALRGPCPACKSGGDRALVVTPGRRAYFCFAQNKGGSVLDLWAHIEGCGLPEAGKAIEDSFGLEKPDRSPSPTKKASTSRETTRQSKPEQPFDPEAFTAKLAYSDEVAALGFSEEDAEHFGVGFYRGKVYAPLRHPTGEIACFYDYGNGTLKLPARARWLEQSAPNVIPFGKKSA